ncbi:hypothetical protein CDL15_Pgr013432 [Punica granatum]|uniref:R13L1/DRL21-like LRR repeat region domain-containing protein n=1 Tax=Punica granatum TaxID=22663 RepID=A0A218W0D9_PUNGR|nr:hypothetical protein CDL15_Pgr013432 [Punica granatum]
MIEIRPSDLIKLETLSKFIVGGDSGARLRELKDLQFLREELTIEGLGNVGEVGDAREAALNAKTGLTSLILGWGQDEGPASGRDAESQMQILDCLQPHASIKNIEIDGYGGEQSISTALQADAANNSEVVNAKTGLTSLILGWGQDEGPASGRDAESQMQILDCLQPHASIKNIEIDGYGGTKLSSWIGGLSFVHLERLRLCNCRKTEMLPSLGVLPQLKELEVERMDAICAVGPEFYGNTAKPFPALETAFY